VSGLVTIYNREKLLPECVQSFLASNWPDFELILVDDCSSDRSWNICLELQAADKRVRCFRNERNLGDYANRNRAASHAEGRYLKYLDADDTIYPHSLRVMVEAMETFPTAALALSANVIDPEVPYPEKIDPPEFFRRHFLGRSPIGVGPSAAIIRRDCFEAVGGFSGRQFVGDTELWLKLAERWPVVLLPPALVWWRRHEGQQMSLEMKRPEVLNIRYQLNQQVLRVTQHLTADEKRNAEARLRRNHARMLISIALRQRRPDVAAQQFMASGLRFTDFLNGIRGYS
jgi:glycosyltransferase involved in cell wall biosynthesis